MSQKRIPTPTQDAGNWGTILNDHLAQTKNPINGAFNSFDQFTSRPTNLTFDDAGRTYLYTQTGNWHEWSGTEWKVQNKSEINVRDYGAVGDGVVDDTVAIRFAITKGNKIFFPNGTYLTDTIVFPPNYYPSTNPAYSPTINDESKTLYGESATKTILLQKTANKAVVEFDGYPSYGHTLSGFTIKPNVNTNYWCAIDMGGCFNCVVEKIYFVDNGDGIFNWGVFLTTLSRTNTYTICHENIVRSVKINNSRGPKILIKVGLQYAEHSSYVPNFEDSPNLNYLEDISVVSCNFPTSSVQAGVSVSSSLNVHVKNSHFEGINGIGVYLGANVQSTTIERCYFEFCTKSIVSKAHDLVLLGCFINGGSEALSAVENTGRITAIGCSEESNGSVGACIGAYRHGKKNSSSLLVGKGDLFVDYADGGSNDGAALALASNANQSYVYFNTYYGNFSNQGNAIRRTRTGNAAKITFTQQEANSGYTNGEITFEVAKNDLENTVLNGDLKRMLKIRQDEVVIGVPKIIPQNVEAGQMSFYLDEVTNKLKVTAKKSDGTTLNFELPSI